MPFIGNQPARIPLTSADITDGIIVNADISSNAGITLNKISGNTSFKNVIINGGFIINQRGHTSGTALASGSYGHDRWKGGASGGTYTFTQGSTGVNTTLTITAGSIIQVIEGANLGTGGTYVLSWTGTAQGKIGSGSFSSSGVTGTITAGINTNIEFNTGTCGNVQLELGSVATDFEFLPIDVSLYRCKRYFQKTTTNIYRQHGNWHGLHWSGSAHLGSMATDVEMRTDPTLSYDGTWAIGGGGSESSGYTPSGSSIHSSGALQVVMSGTQRASGHSLFGYTNSASCFIAWSAEL
jgi:hypothetical protein